MFKHKMVKINRLKLLTLNNQTPLPRANTVTDRTNTENAQTYPWSAIKCSKGLQTLSQTQNLLDI